MKDEQGLFNKTFIIPAIDIIDGKCVRLSRGDFSASTIYDHHPLAVAKRFEDAGVERLHLVDLDGAKIGKVSNWKVLEDITSKTKLKIDFGGGLKSEEDLRIVFDSGARWAAIGSIAVTEREKFSQWIADFGGDKFLLGADVKNERIAIRGWQEITEITVYELISLYTKLGITQIFCTDVSRDGMLAGPAVELYKKILAEFPEVKLIASGGVSSVQDVQQLYDAGCLAVIVGKAIYEGRINLNELEKMNLKIK